MEARAKAKREAFEAQARAEREAKESAALRLVEDGWDVANLGASAQAEIEEAPEELVESQKRRGGKGRFSRGTGSIDTADARDEEAEVERASNGGETPAKLFERIMAPVYIPPSVKRDRPDLVERYQPSVAPKASAQASRKKGGEVKPPVSETGTGDETPAKLFERIMAPVYIPPSVKRDRPDLVERYQPDKGE